MKSILHYLLLGTSLFIPVVYGKTDDPIILTGEATTVIDTIKATQYLGAGSAVDLSSSGYYAVHSGCRSIELALTTGKPKESLIKSFQDQSSAQQFFGEETSCCRSHVIESRKNKLITDYIKDQLLLQLADTHEVAASELSYKDLISRDLYLLTARKGLITPNDNISRERRSELNFLAQKLIPEAAPLLVPKLESSGTSTITKEDIYAALEQASFSARNPDGIAFNAAFMERNLPHLVQITGLVNSLKNYLELRTGDTKVCTRNYGPQGMTDLEKKKNQEHELDGSWLLESEIKNLSDHLLKNTTGHSIEQLGAEIPIKTLEFANSSMSLTEELKNSSELLWLSKELTKKPKDFIALFFISFDKQWTSCLIHKSQDDVQLIIVDPCNVDRLHEQGIKDLCKTITNGLAPKEPTQDRKKPNLLKDLLNKTEGETEKKKEGEETVNYDAPLAGIPLEKLPRLEDFFGDDIPNAIKVRMHQLSGKSLTNRDAGTKLKNCLLLYGPPGTGKSTIAQIMARTAGRNVVYAGGGQFRTAYQGSGNAKIQALFAEAKKRGNCVLIIDEIDGASSQLKGNNGTQEDNRAIKALITTLDQNRYSDIYVICTSNYPEQMDPAIFRRFNAIEIPLPNYQQRKKIIEYYFKKNDIAVEKNNPQAVTPIFFDKFISITDSLSGDDISDIICNAVCEYDAGLKPEKPINLGFRWSGIDFSNKPMLTNIGRILSYPFMPLKMILNDEHNTELDKHLFSQYKLRIKKRNDMERNEWLNDPANKYGKDPFLKRLFKRNRDKAGDIFENTLWMMLASKALKKVPGIGQEEDSFLANLNSLFRGSKN